MICLLTVSVPITVITPSAPTNVDASDMLVGKVRVSWVAVTDATHYQVYLANSLIGTKIPISGCQNENYYLDSDVTPGTTYWYWGKTATSDSGGNASE